jgi:hypothetical protein
MSITVIQFIVFCVHLSYDTYYASVNSKIPPALKKICTSEKISVLANILLMPFLAPGYCTRLSKL